MQFRDLEGEIALQEFFVILALFVVHNVIHHIVDLLVIHIGDIDPADITIDPNHRWKSRGQMQV